MRYPKPGRGQSGDQGELGQNLLQGQVFATEDVSSPGSAAIVGEEMTACDVVHVHHVEHRVDVARHASVEEVDDEAAARRRGAIARAEGHRGLYERHGQSFGRRPQHLVLRDVFGSLVRAEQVAQVRVVGLGGRLSARHGGEPDRPHGARVDDPPHAGRAGRGQHLASAVDVHLVEQLRITGPESI
jgi:hypothetical protein